MSYILDALEKANAQRGEAQLPPGTANRPISFAAPRASHTVLIVVLAAVLVFVALGTAWWWLQGRDASKEATAFAKPEVVATAAPASVIPAVPVPVPTQLHMPVPERATAPVYLPAAPAPIARSVPPVPKPAAPAGAMRADLPTPLPAPVLPQTLPDLPSDVRASLPPLTVSGGSYSDQAALRMVIVNGRVFHEGEELVAGVLLEQIQAKSLVLKVRGGRYGVRY